MLAEVPTVVSDIGGLDEIVTHGVDGLKAYAGNANSLADSILSFLYNHKLCQEVSKNAKAKVKNKYGWNKICEETHFIYQKAICETVAKKQENEIAQEKAKKTKKAKQTETEITKLIDFRERKAYA